MSVSSHAGSQYLSHYPGNTYERPGTYQREADSSIYKVVQFLVFRMGFIDSPTVVRWVFRFAEILYRRSLDNLSTRNSFINKGDRRQTGERLTFLLAFSNTASFEGSSAFCFPLPPLGSAAVTRWTSEISPNTSFSFSFPFPLTFVCFGSSGTLKTLSGSALTTPKRTPLPRSAATPFPFASFCFLGGTTPRVVLLPTRFRSLPPMPARDPDLLRSRMKNAGGFRGIGSSGRGPGGLVREAGGR